MDAVVAAAAALAVKAAAMDLVVVPTAQAAVSID